MLRLVWGLFATHLGVMVGFVDVFILDVSRVGFAGFYLYLRD